LKTTSHNEKTSILNKTIDWLKFEYNFFRPQFEYIFFRTQFNKKKSGRGKRGKSLREGGTKKHVTRHAKRKTVKAMDQCAILQ
jgi:hypothetical protein